MITNKQMADILTAKLNVFNSQTPNPMTLNGRPFEFLIHSNLGDYEHSINGTQRKLSTILINGVLGAQTSTPLPYAGLGSTLLMQSLNLLVPVDTTTKTGGIDYAINLIDAFAQNVAGFTGTLKDADNTSFSYVLSVSTPYVGQEDYYGEIGKAVPVVLQVSWQFIKDGVLANAVKMTLKADDENTATALVLLDGAFTRTRTGDAVNIDGQQEMKTTITQQGLVFRVVMSYKRGDASQTLMGDLLGATSQGTNKGLLERKYTLAYDDRERDESGALITGARGFNLSWSVVAKEISVATTAGKNITLTALFTIAR